MQLNNETQTSCYWQHIHCWYETEFKRLEINGIGIDEKNYIVTVREALGDCLLKKLLTVGDR